MSDLEIKSLYSLLPDTPSIKLTLDFIRKYLDDPTYNHVVRSGLFSSIYYRNLTKQGVDTHLIPVDEEVVVVAGLLHDMSWNPECASTRQFISKDKRFEVDGANAAREFLMTLPKEYGWDKRRTQLVWDAIALHATRSIGWYKEPEVVLCGYGITTDVFKSPKIPLPGVPEPCKVSQEEFDKIYSKFPSLHLGRYINGALCAICREKPDTTYDNFVGWWGAEYIEGFKLKDNQMVEPLKKREQQEESEP